MLVANAATHMGMEVYGYDPYISVNAAWNLSRSVKHISNVEDIYKECDYITIHVPLLDSTRKMIDANAIAMMKPTAIVLNFARDLLVDEEAMVDALAAGKIKKYVSDFPNTTTVGAKGCIVTPHLEHLQQSLKTTAQLWLSVRFVTTWRMVILPILSIIRLQHGSMYHSRTCCNSAQECQGYDRPVYDRSWRGRYQCVRYDK